MYKVFTFSDAIETHKAANDVRKIQKIDHWPGDILCNWFVTPQAYADDRKAIIPSSYGVHCKLVIIKQFHGRAGNLAKKFQHSDGVSFFFSRVLFSENAILTIQPVKEVNDWKLAACSKYNLQRWKSDESDSITIRFITKNAETWSPYRTLRIMSNVQN